MVVVENIIWDQAEKLMGVSTKVTTRLDTVAEDMAQLSTLLESMWDNKEERTAVMVKYRERMDQGVSPDLSSDNRGLFRG